jgi:hypothetical protein
MLSLAVISGCVIPTEAPGTLSSSVLTPTQQVAHTQSTPALPPTSTPRPTATSTPTRTVTALPTTPSPLTPLPTLPPDQAEALVQELLENNAGCQLPCWWGFVPGQTEWQKARQFLDQVAVEIYVSSPNQPLFFANVLIPVSEGIYPVYRTHTYTVQNGIIEVIEVQQGAVPGYDLSAFLKTHGVPTEIRLRTYSQAREGDLQFDVVLFYPEQGILARYATQAQAIGSHIRGCPQQEPAAILALWSPERELTFSESSSQTIDIRNEDWWPYRPLQEVTQMDVATFYQVFQSSDNADCLETPADLWPQP